MLVHMSPKEVAGLQALAKANGGSLTVNPDTGLVEAGFLDKMLPMIAGAGLMMIPGVNALGAAAIVGGIQAMRTGDVKEGLIAGLGAYGGAGLTAGLAEAGGSALADQAAAQAAQQTGANAVATIPTEFTGVGMPTEFTGLPNAAPQTMTQATQAQIGNFANLTPGQSEAFNAAAQTQPEFAAQAAARANATQAPMYERAMAGLNTMNPFSANVTAGQAASNVGNLAMENKGALMAAATPAINQSMQPAAAPGPAEPDQYDKKLAGFKLSKNFQPYTPQQPNPYYQAQYPTYAAGGLTGQPQLEQMAPGGLASLQGQRDGYEPRLTALGEESQYAEGGMTETAAKKRKKPQHTGGAALSAIGATQGPWAQAQAELENDMYNAKMPTGVTAPQARIKGLGEYNYAAGGSLGGYSDGGRMLKGPGDGMSDSIPARIGSKQPARLADGEFVIPADVVSHIGNGSSDAGAKKLYAMMDKARMARTGKKKQAPAVNPNKFMPV
jgi:hypothetical protein